MYFSPTYCYKHKKKIKSISYFKDTFGNGKEVILECGCYFQYRILGNGKEVDIRTGKANKKIKGNES